MIVWLIGGFIFVRSLYTMGGGILGYTTFSSGTKSESPNPATLSFGILNGIFLGRDCWKMGWCLLSSTTCCFGISTVGASLMISERPRPATFSFGIENGRPFLGWGGTTTGGVSSLCSSLESCSGSAAATTTTLTCYAKSGVNPERPRPSILSAGILKGRGFFFSCYITYSRISGTLVSIA